MYTGQGTPRVDKCLAEILGVQQGATQDETRAALDAALVAEPMVSVVAKDAPTTDDTSADTPAPQPVMSAELAKLVEIARACELDADKYRYACDEMLNGTFAPLLPSSADLSDEDLTRMAWDCGWRVTPGTIEPPEAWTAWLNRLRRFAALVRSTPV